MAIFIYILKRSSNLLALSVKLTEFLYLLAGTTGINTRQDRIDGRKPVRMLVLEFRRKMFF